MKLLAKILIIPILLLLLWIGLRLTSLKIFRIPTASMENTISTGSRLLVWKKNFKPVRFEIIVYHNPDFDTILSPKNPMPYYAAVRTMGKEIVDQEYQKVFVPLEKREQWIGRCVGLPGDKIQLENGNLYVNGVPDHNENIKKVFLMEFTNGTSINQNLFDSVKVKKEDINNFSNNYLFPATREQAKILLSKTKVDTSFFIVDRKDNADKMIFPFSNNFKWNKDFFGEIQVPKSGERITLNINNIPLYTRLIESFENNSVIIKDSIILINNIKCDSFVPKYDYYFIINDNRDNSLDSRYWGFLPENHISGKILKVLN